MFHGLLLVESSCPQSESLISVKKLLEAVTENCENLREKSLAPIVFMFDLSDTAPVLVQPAVYIVTLSSARYIYYIVNSHDAGPGPGPPLLTLNWRNNLERIVINVKYHKMQFETINNQKSKESKLKQ